MDQTSLLQLLGQLQNLDPPAEKDVQAAPPDEVKDDIEQAPEATIEAANDDDGQIDEPQEEEDGALEEATTASNAPEPSEAPEVDNESATNTELERLLASLLPLDPSAYSTSTYPDYPEYPSAASSASYAELTSYLSEPAPPPAVPTPPIYEEPPDIRKYTFAQALPVVSRLAENPSFIDKLQQVHYLRSLHYKYRADPGAM